VRQEQKESPPTILERRAIHHLSLSQKLDGLKPSSL